MKAQNNNQGGQVRKKRLNAPNLDHQKTQTLKHQQKKTINPFLFHPLELHLLH